MDTLDSNRKFIKEQLAEKLPLAQYRIPNCSYLAWIDLSGYELGANPAEQLLEHGRVAFTPGHLFGSGCDGFVRLNFATSQEVIAEGIDRLVAGIEKLKASK
jgi:cystathionine beta-lyase